MKRYFLGFLICGFAVCLIMWRNSGYRADYELEDGSSIRIRRGHLISFQKDGKTLAEKTSRKKIYFSKMLDIDGDDEKELLILLGSSRVNEPKELCIFKSDLTYVVKDFSVSRLNPIDFMVGEVNGDGVRELLMLVYKTSRLHPIYTIRPFFYQVSEGTLKPLWRGSRLSAPFTELLLTDTDGDGVDELLAVEYNHYKRKYIRAYRWNGFGFTAFADTEDYLHIHGLSMKDAVPVARFLDQKETLRRLLVGKETIHTKEMSP